MMSLNKRWYICLQDFDLPDGVWIVEAVLNEDDWEDQKRFDVDLDENVQAFSSNDSKIQTTSYEDQQSVLSLPLERTHQEDLSSSDRFISSWPGVEKMIHGNKIQTKFSEQLTSTCPRGAEILKNTELSKASEASSDEAISKKIESSEAIGNNAISKTILSSEAISVEASSEANSDEAITKKIELTEAICNYTISTEIASSEASIVVAKALDESTNLTLNNLGKVQECVKHNICEDETDYVESDAFKMKQESCSAYTTKENFNGCAVIPVCDTDSDNKFVDTNQQMDLNIRPLDNSSNVQLNGEVICSDNLQHLNNSENSTLCEELLHLIGDKTALKNNNSADTVSTNGIKTDILSTNDSSTDIASANGSNTDSILSEYVNVSSSIVAVQNCQKSQSNGNLNASDKFTQSIDGSVNSSDIPFVQCSQNEAETNSIHTLSMYSNNAAAPNVYVPKYTPVTLYAQANSDMVLILLLDEQSVALHKAIVRDIWMRSISSFAKFEPQLKDMAEEAKSQQLLQSNASSWLCYNKASHAFQGSLSALHPVSVADHAFCEAASLIHEDFHSIEGPTEILLRSGVGTIYAHSEGSTEIFVKSPLNKVSAGIPSRRDVESCIKIAQQKLKDLPPINSQ